MSLTSRLQALLDYANNKTEKNDPNLGEAVRSLVEGYGRGGVNTLEFLYEETITEDETRWDIILNKGYKKLLFVYNFLPTEGNTKEQSASFKIFYTETLNEINSTLLYASRTKNEYKTAVLVEALENGTYLVNNDKTTILNSIKNFTGNEVFGINLWVTNGYIGAGSSVKIYGY